MQQRNALWIWSAVALVALIIFFAYELLSPKVPARKDYQSLTPEEKEAVIDSLSAPSGSLLAPAVAKEAVSSASASTSKTQLPPKERSSMLDSLQAR
jgi:hypothetical protein